MIRFFLGFIYLSSITIIVVGNYFRNTDVDKCFNQNVYQIMPLSVWLLILGTGNIIIISVYWILKIVKYYATCDKLLRVIKFLSRNILVFITLVYAYTMVGIGIYQFYRTLLECQTINRMLIIASILVWVIELSFGGYVTMYFLIG